MFIDELFNNDKILNVLPKSIDFLLELIRCDLIPENDELKGRCFFLLLSHLNGVLDLLIFYLHADDERDETLEEIECQLEDIFQTIIEAVPKALKYKEFSVEVTKQLCGMMESNYDILINEKNCLHIYGSMLQIDVSQELSYLKSNKFLIGN